MIFSNASRKEKSVFLEEIIKTLPIRNEEKDLYFFSMEILNDSDFEKFFHKIVSNFSEKNTEIQFVHE